MTSELTDTSTLYLLSSPTWSLEVNLILRGRSRRRREDVCEPDSFDVSVRELFAMNVESIVNAKSKAN